MGSTTYVVLTGNSAGKGDGGVGFYHWTGTTIPAHRGYVTISGAAAARLRISFGDNAEGTEPDHVLLAGSGEEDDELPVTPEGWPEGVPYPW